MDAERIKFTPAMVEEVAKRAKRITHGQFALGVQGVHPEHGTSYSDAHEQITWYGPKGARGACAYYSAGAMAWLGLNKVRPEGDDGEFFLAVQVAYSRYGDFTKSDRGWFEHWEARGAKRAREVFGG